MVGKPWDAFGAEIARWSDAGKPVEFWWRDDDACRRNSALSRLCTLSAESGVPLALAAVPEQVEPGALDDLPVTVTVIQHGTNHSNRAPEGEKKTEFSALEPTVAAMARLTRSFEKLGKRAPGKVLPVLAPPWNRVLPSLLPHLVTAGYVGVSTYGVRNVTNLPSGLTQVNTHVDIIDWKTSRAFCGADVALGQAVRHLAARREGRADRDEPTGWLTHHLDHDDACWSFLESLFEFTRGFPGISWRAPATLFPPNS